MTPQSAFLSPTRAHGDGGTSAPASPRTPQDAGADTEHPNSAANTSACSSALRTSRRTRRRRAGSAASVASRRCALGSECATPGSRRCGTLDTRSPAAPSATDHASTRTGSPRTPRSLGPPGTAYTSCASPGPRCSRSDAATDRASQSPLTPHEREARLGSEPSRGPAFVNVPRAVCAAGLTGGRSRRVKRKGEEGHRPDHNQLKRCRCRRDRDVLRAVAGERLALPAAFDGEPDA